jgi:hypothetical protein
MRPPKVYILGGAILLLFLGIGVAWAMSSTSFNLVKNTNEGGGAGGNAASSSNYQLANSVQGAVQESSSSSGYRLCSGFLCGGTPAIALPEVHLPLVIKNYPP